MEVSQKMNPSPRKLYSNYFINWSKETFLCKNYLFKFKRQNIYRKTFWSLSIFIPFSNEDNLLVMKSSNQNFIYKFQKNQKIFLVVLYFFAHSIDLSLPSFLSKQFLECFFLKYLIRRLGSNHIQTNNPQPSFAIILPLTFTELF